MKNIPKEIKRIRKRLGWTQTELANYLGLKTASVGHYETGLNEPKASTWIKIQELSKLKRAS